MKKTVMIAIGIVMTTMMKMKSQTRTRDVPVDIIVWIA